MQRLVDRPLKKSTTYRCYTYETRGLTTAIGKRRGCLVLSVSTTRTQADKSGETDKDGGSPPGHRESPGRIAGAPIKHWLRM